MQKYYKVFNNLQYSEESQGKTDIFSLITERNTTYTWISLVYRESGARNPVAKAWSILKLQPAFYLRSLHAIAICIKLYTHAVTCAMVGKCPLIQKY